VIVTTGASPRRLSIPGEDKFYGRGVSTCATCDAAFFKDKTVVVAGGGDTAMEYALILAKFATKVYIVHRRDTFRASEIMQKRALENPKIEVLWNTEVKEVLGDSKVTGLKIFNNKTNQTTEQTADGMFLAVGNIPNTNFLVKHLPLDEEGYIVVDNVPFTKTEGVFVAGEIVDHKYKQAIISAGDGCKAAIDAGNYLAELG
jgi:thioredoxin reductase (NADPH)